MQTLITPQGELQLTRYPIRRNDPLRAWDAADEYLLDHIYQQHLNEPATLIVNDSFGCLAVALSPWRPASLSDSRLAQLGTLHNLRHNNRPEGNVTLLNSLDTPPSPMDLIVIKVPKSLALLEEQLHRIRPCIAETTQIIAAGMAKGIHNSTLRLFERIIGPTHTSLAKKKARLIFCAPQPQLKSPANPYPIRYYVEGMDGEIINHANVFSREKLDIGTRFFMEQLPADNRYQHIVDLGCGNGLLGLVAAQRNPGARLIFVDESYMAVASAQANFTAAFPGRSATFHVGDCLQGIAKNSVELILNNPPFHQQNAISSHIAEQMFRESKAVLKPGGELWVIGNRHLQYHIKLKQLFDHCEVVASNPKFVVLKAIKR